MNICGDVSPAAAGDLVEFEYIKQTAEMDVLTKRETSAYVVAETSVTGASRRTKSFSCHLSSYN